MDSPESEASERIGPDGIDDTSPEAARVQIEMLRRMTPAQRLVLAGDLSQSVRMLARAGIRLREGTIPPERVTLRLVEICYGRKLAEAFASALVRGRRNA